MAKGNKKELSSEERKELLKTLKARFEKNTNRHKGLEWAKVEARLNAASEKLWSLNEMEKTGGEPDVVVPIAIGNDNLPAGRQERKGEYIFYDCSTESPAGRRSFCYDHQALNSRKEHKPKNSVVDMAAAIGIEVLSEEEYLDLQKLGKFDSKTSSWIKTPDKIRELGGAISGEFRFGRVFVYANGAESYFASRGFRGSLRV